MYKSCCVVLYSSISIALLTARVFQDRSQPQQLTLCRSLHAEALEATVSEGLAQGPYVVARAGFDPTTSRKASTLPMCHCAPFAVCVHCDVHTQRPCVGRS